MDILKPFDEICCPDSRQKAFALYNRETGVTRERTLHDHYEAINDIVLNDTVPEKLREHFETARNLLLYSWYVCINWGQISFVIIIKSYNKFQYPSKLRQLFRKRASSRSFGIRNPLTVTIQNRDKKIRHCIVTDKDMFGHVRGDLNIDILTARPFSDTLGMTKTPYRI